MGTLRRYTPLAVLLVLVVATVGNAQTGKISGQVTDAETGEPIPGANVVVQERQAGSTTDADGFYSILNLPPGTYTIQASFVGYADQVVEGVEVDIDLTSTVNIELQEETQQLSEVTVSASDPVVQPDVSANVANLEAEQFENLPVASVSEVLNLQAGIEPGMSVRGGGLSELSFVVDGMTMRTGRNNQPFTNISFTSVKEVQVQTGGFNAEYGNVRSGLVNVVTKDAPRDRYSVDAMVRYTPPQAKSFGGLPEDRDGFYMRPYLDDPDVPNDRDPAFVGTENGPWDKYERRQYPEFGGWNSIAEGLANDNDPTNNMNPDQLMELFNFRHRKSNEITVPDYEADLTVGGPLVPGLSSSLGDLRFLASYRQTQTAYNYPMMRDSYDEQTGQLKVTTDITSTMKLTLEGLYGQQKGMNDDFDRGDVNIWTGEIPDYPWSRPQLTVEGSLEEDWLHVLFSPHAHNPVQVEHRMIGGEFTHTLNQNTFYRAGLQRMSSEYRSSMPPSRDFETDAFCIDANPDQQVEEFCFNEAPYGFPAAGGNTLSGMITGGGWAKTRDTTNVNVWTGKFDLTSQLNQYSQLKTGVDAIYNDYNVRWGWVNLGYLSAAQGDRHNWDRQPIQGAAYVQNKLEFRGMIANVGLRFDYLDSNTQWWVYDTYEENFSQRSWQLDEFLDKEKTDPTYALSPRLGVSFPVTSSSKLYFNYGHFRQMMDPTRLLGVEDNTEGIEDLANPEHPMPQTVAYELGFDQNLADMFLLRVSGYYRDVRKQPRGVHFTNLDGSVGYTTYYPWNYEDIRGAEFTLSKNRGAWVRGFVNYTFMARSGGNFGFGQFNENTFDQRQYMRFSTDYRQYRPVPQPYARAHIELIVPQDYGPTVGGIPVLGNWRAGLLGTWRDGRTFTWRAGNNSPALRNNVSWSDYYNFDLRFSRKFSGAFGEVQLFADISNVFNIRHLYGQYAFRGLSRHTPRDREFYLKSLHLPGNTFSALEEDPYLYVYGDDEPGDFREPGVEFQPVEVVQNLETVTEKFADESQRAYFYSKEVSDYFQWTGNSFEEVSDDKVEKMLDEKAYIDMPNQEFTTFLNPRRVTFGLRLSF